MLDYKEGWAPKNWCFQTVVLEKTLESPLDCKEIKPVNPKGDQPWIFIGRTDAEAEVPILWLLDVKSWIIGKDPDAGKDWRQEEKGTTEDEMVGWHHWVNGHEFGSFLYSSSVYSCHLFLISSASVRSIPFLTLLSPSLHEMFPCYLWFSWREMYMSA